MIINDYSAKLDVMKHMGAQALSDEQIAMLREFASALVVPLPPCDETTFAKYLRIMDANLKQRDTDYGTGKIRQRIYYARLGARYPADAVQHMVTQCIDTMIFFPVVFDCLEIIKTWEHPGRSMRKVATAILRRNDERLYKQASERLQRGEVEQSEVNSWPLAWKLRLENYFWGLRVVDGQHVLRPRNETSVSD